jgi:dTDP-4-dehydrorhamnose reductase
MRYLIVGGRGMLGSDIAVALSGRDVTVVGSAELDVTDGAAVLAAVEGFDVVINASAYTKVDDAETHEAEAMAVNAAGPENLAIAARETGAVLVHVSTDYVFDGTATSPYAENEPLAPLGAYGRSKAEGERRVLAAHPAGSYIVRTAWLYGEHGPNFARTMLTLAEARPTVSVVDDQLGQPTWTRDLAEQIVALLDQAPAFGVYHGTNSGSATWFEFARAVFEVAGLDPERVLPTTSAAFVRPAPRPAFSVLGHDAWAAAGIPAMRPWRAALEHSFLATSGAVT